MIYPYYLKRTLNEGSYITKNVDGNYYYYTSEGIYECTNLGLLSYNGETNLIVHIGDVIPNVTIKVRQNLTTIINTLQSRLTLLEYTINRVVLLNKETNN